MNILDKHGFAALRPVNVSGRKAAPGLAGQTVATSVVRTGRCELGAVPVVVQLGTEASPQELPASVTFDTIRGRVRWQAGVTIQEMDFDLPAGRSRFVLVADWVEVFFINGTGADLDVQGIVAPALGGSYVPTGQSSPVTFTERRSMVPNSTKVELFAPKWATAVAFSTFGGTWALFASDPAEQLVWRWQGVATQQASDMAFVPIPNAANKVEVVSPASGGPHTLILCWMLQP